MAKYTLDLCRGLAACGWSVTAYTCNAVALDRPFVEHGIDLRHVPLHGLYDIVSTGILVRHLRREAKGTIIHTHRFRDAFCAKMAAMLAVRPDIRVVITRHIPRAARNSFIYRYTYRHIDAHIFTSKKGKDKFMSTLKSSVSLHDERLHVIPPSIPDAPDTPWPEPATGPITARYAGLPAPDSGVETLIDAIPKLRGRRIRFSIPYAPDPDYSDLLRLRAEERGCSDMIDWRSETSTASESLQKSHLCILPAYRHNTFSDAELECLAGGRPMIAPGREDSDWYVGVQYGDADALAEAILRLGSNTTLRREIGMQAFSRFHTHHLWSDYIAAITDVYSEISS